MIAPPRLPPRPYSYSTTALPGQHEGAGHVYIIDATGRKIVSVWGRPDEKIALAELIVEAGKAP
jgi:hypothetical protein